MTYVTWSCVHGLGQASAGTITCAQFSVYGFVVNRVDCFLKVREKNNGALFYFFFFSIFLLQAFFSLFCVCVCGCLRMMKT